jgi:hypothetical protein
MKYLIRRIIFWSVVVAMVGSLAIGIVGAPAFLQPYVFVEGLRTLDGQPVKLATDVYKEDGSEFVLVIYWDTSCKYCEQMLKDAARLRFQVIAVNCGQSQRAVEAYLATHKLSDNVTVLLGFPPQTGYPVWEIAVREGGQWKSLGRKMGYDPSLINNLNSLYQKWIEYRSKGG